MFFYIIKYYLLFQLVIYILLIKAESKSIFQNSKSKLNYLLFIKLVVENTCVRYLKFI